MSAWKKTFKGVSLLADEITKLKANTGAVFNEGTDIEIRGNMNFTPVECDQYLSDGNGGL
ncbi:MAG: hypothetical protein ABSA46_05455 [Thermodesulfovibrionales bacterium]|jgi:hypothetical protein